MHPMRRRRIAPLALSLSLALGAAGCGEATAPAQPAGAATSAAGGGIREGAFPVTLTDDARRPVMVPRAPARIVSAAPSNTEILFALGLGDRVAGVTQFCDFPPAAREKPKIGGLRPNLEAILSLAPELVLAIRVTPPDAIAALEAQRVPVAVLQPADFAGVLANVRAVGRLTGAVGAAEGVATGMQGRWEAVAARAGNPARRPRVLYEIDGSDPSAVSAAGPGTFIDAMIVTVGGENVLATLTPGQPYPRLSAEAVLQADPDVILLGDAASGQSLETLTRRPGWGALSAVQRGAVVPIADSDVTSRPGPRLVEGLETIARAVRPEVFGAP